MIRSAGVSILNILCSTCWFVGVLASERMFGTLACVVEPDVGGLTWPGCVDDGVIVVGVAASMSASLLWVSLQRRVSVVRS